MSLFCEAQGQKTEPPSISVRSLETAKLVNEKHEPIEVAAKVRLQTSGIAISSLRVFYRSSADAAFKKASCELLPSLKYYVRLSYSPLIEYYFVATPLAGSSIKFGEGKIVGPDLEPRPWPGTDPWTSYAAAGAAGIMATVVSVLLNSDAPATAARASRNSPALYLTVGALAAGVTASMIYLKTRHDRLKDRVSDDPSKRLSDVR